MKKINLLFQTILLLLSSGIDGTTNNETPPLTNNQSGQEQQNISSTCHAVRAILDHEGKIAQWKSNCRVEIWNDKERPELKDLTEDQKESVIKSLSQPSQPQDATTAPAACPFTNPINSNTLEKSKYLKDEANLQHYMCMEAKRSLLSQLKAQMKCSAVSTIQTLKLTPELEAFIGQVNESMKESLARIHNLEQSGSQQLDALKTENANLTALIDEYCKDDHPSIRYHDVGYLPNQDLGKVKMTLVISKPGQRAEFFNLPESAYARHIEYLRGMTDAAAQHAQITGQRGDFEVVHHPYPNPVDLEKLKSFLAMQPNSEVPSVISVTPSKSTQLSEQQQSYNDIDRSASVAVEEKSQLLDENAPKEDLDLNKILNPDNLNTPQLSDNLKTPELSENSLIPDSSPSPSSSLTEISEKNLIKDFWEKIFKTEKDLATTIDIWSKNLKSNPKDQILKHQATFELKNAQDNYTSETEQAILKLIDSAKYETSSPVPKEDSLTIKFWKKPFEQLINEEKAIEAKFLRSRELLMKARDYIQPKKTFFSKTTLADKIYNIGEKKIISDREAEKKALMDKNPPTAPAPKVGKTIFSLFRSSPAAAAAPPKSS